jgi:hypothetical protein
MWHSLETSQIDSKIQTDPLSDVSGHAEMSPLQSLVSGECGWGRFQALVLGLSMDQWR